MRKGLRRDLGREPVEDHDARPAGKGSQHEIHLTHHMEERSDPQEHVILSKAVPIRSAERPIR